MVVEVWAPWCAPCAVFKREVLTDTNRAALARRAELVELDLDREETAPFSERYGVLPLPSVLVLDPKDGRVLAQRSGLMSFADLEALVVAAAKPTDSARETLADARALRKAGKKSEAAGLFEVASGVTTGATREEAVLAALDLYREVGAHTRCVSLARDTIDPPGLAGPPASEFRLAVLQAHLRCTIELPEEIPRNEEYRWLDRAATAFGSDHAGRLAPRVHADLCALLIILATWRGDIPAARHLEEVRLSAIEHAIGEAKDPLVAASFDADRTSILLALTRERVALDALRERAVALPSNYEVHGRLGTALARVGKHAESLGPLTRAIELAYGAPKLIYQHRLADAHAALGDKEKAREQLRAAKAGWAALAESQRDPARQAEVERALAALE